MWDFARRTAYQLIDSVKIIENVRNCAQKLLPETESQARPLTKLEPEQQREAWKKAVETAPEGKVTAAHVSKVVKKMTAQPKNKEESKASYMVSEAMRIARRFCIYLFPSVLRKRTLNMLLLHSSINRNRVVKKIQDFKYVIL